MWCTKSANCQFVSVRVQKHTAIEEAFCTCFLLCQMSCGLWCVCVWEAEKILFLLCLSLILPLTFNCTATQSAGQREKGVSGVKACVCPVALDGRGCIAMRRALRLSVFRGYRRAGEDDDEVFVCSPGHKVTRQIRSWNETLLRFSWNKRVIFLTTYLCAVLRSPINIEQVVCFADADGFHVL